jgi:hypothetical protein
MAQRTSVRAGAAKEFGRRLILGKEFAGAYSIPS